MSSVINVKPVRNAENNVHPVQSNKKHMTIKLANLNLDAVREPLHVGSSLARRLFDSQNAEIQGVIR